MDYKNIIGIIAGVLIVIGYLPQLVKIVVHKSAHDVSVTMYVLFLIAQMLWCIYGFLVVDHIVIWTNIASCIISIFIIISSVYYQMLYKKQIATAIETALEALES